MVAEKAGQARRQSRPLVLFVFFLEVQFQPELELTRIEGRSRTAVVTTIAGALVKRIDVINERRRGCLVKPVKEIETFGDDIQTNPFTEPHLSHQTHVQ